MIERLSFPEYLDMPDGLEVPPIEDLSTLLRQIVPAYGDDFITLGPGPYNLTPKVWADNLNVHELTVYDDGTGLYRLTPKYANVINRLTFGNSIKQARTIDIKIPDDRRIVCIINNARTRLFEVVFFVEEETLLVSQENRINFSELWRI